MLANYFEENQKVFYVFLALSFLPLLTGTSLAYFIYEHYQTIKTFSTKEWLLVYTFLALAMGLNGVPNNLIAACGGYFLGFSSLLYLSPAYMVACVIGYVLGRNFLNEKVKNDLLKDKSLEKYLEKVQKNEFSTVVLTKVSPVMPFLVTNALFGMLRYKPVNFLMGCFVGKWPRVALFTFIGTTIMEFQSFLDGSYSKQSWVYLVLLALVTISLAGLYFTIIKPAQKNEKIA
ncbi:MAG: VTT domain-containing protein [Cytophagales bacterium]